MFYFPMINSLKSLFFIKEDVGYCEVHKIFMIFHLEDL